MRVWHVFWTIQILDPHCCVLNDWFRNRSAQDFQFWCVKVTFLRQRQYIHARDICWLCIRSCGAHDWHELFWIRKLQVCILHNFNMHFWPHWGIQTLYQYQSGFMMMSFQYIEYWILWGLTWYWQIGEHASYFCNFKNILTISANLKSFMAIFAIFPCIQ